MKSMIHSWKRKSAQYRELKKQKGVTLLEIIIVLGIIGIIAAGVVILAQRAFTSQDISDLTDNTNSVRVAMTEAYKDSDQYPARQDSNAETKAGIETSTGLSAIVGLVKMGKIGPSEAFNGFSNDAFEIGPAKLAADATKNKAFFMVINGLEMEDCRNIVSQVGSQWDYVATTTAAAGAMSGVGAAAIDISVAANPASGILKTTTADQLTPANIVATGVCDTDPTGPTNAIVLGSR
ncbi:MULTISPECIES: type IV pilus major pilin [Citrobacter]|uniref:type IV pilus major pilin n=1 Tax=Citrobacter TaxID=544 RepID=UPI000CEE9E8D|nr:MULTISPECIES: type IV pilus major pilin [Citrobacter]PPS48666.1 type IV pilin [Citrobacter braakii]QLK37436.1 type IV pilus major pilin [Citrobacter sp. 172116965]